MKERAIILSGPKVLSILEGQKTEERRPIPDAWWICLDPEEEEDRERAVLQRSTFGALGERLWVRESWRSWRWNDGVSAQDFPRRWGNEDPRKYVGYVAGGDIVREGLQMDGRIRSSVHLPRWAARIILEVAEVRIERLWDVTESGAKAEGFKPLDLGNISSEQTFCGEGFDGPRFGQAPRRAAMAIAWDGLYEDTSAAWVRNPWVWVVGFKRISP